MSLEVKLETPPGHKVETRVFDPGQRVRIGAHVSGAFGIGGWGNTVRIEVTSDTGAFTPLFAEVSTNPLGDAWADFDMPTVRGKAIITVTVTFGISGQETRVIPIGIGAEIMPDPVPAPAEGGSWLTYAALGAVAILVIVLVIRR